MKKYLNIDFIGTMVLVLGCLFVSIELIKSSYDYFILEDFPTWIGNVVRVSGILGAIVFSCIGIRVFRYYERQED